MSARIKAAVKLNTVCNNNEFNIKIVSKNVLKCFSFKNDGLFKLFMIDQNTQPLINIERLDILVRVKFTKNTNYMYNNCKLLLNIAIGLNCKRNFFQWEIFIYSEN